MRTPKQHAPASTELVFSHHALSRMAQRGVSSDDVRHIVGNGASVPDAAPAGAAPRTRTTGTRNGRRITVVVGHEPSRRIVITVF